jgi:glucokinase
MFPTTYRSTDIWTVADIGGTHARLARWSPESGLGPIEHRRNDDFAGPIDLLDDWFRGASERRLLLALAMPIGVDARTLTNRDWVFDPAAILDSLRLIELQVVNDFAAAAAGVDGLPPTELEALNDVDAPPANATRVILGPGTGLGTAAILRNSGPPRVLASEAGHMNLGSSHPISAALLAEGRRRWGRVSWERVLCGKGLAWIDAVLNGHSEPTPPEGVSARAVAGEKAALETARTFSHILGEYAGDVCLAFQALGGVALYGGVLRGLGAAFDRAAFLGAFANKGRLSPQLRSVPSVLAAGHELGIRGAARLLEGQCTMPSVRWRA